MFWQSCASPDKKKNYNYLLKCLLTAQLDSGYNYECCQHVVNKINLNAKNSLTTGWEFVTLNICTLLFCWHENVQQQVSNLLLTEYLTLTVMNSLSLLTNSFGINWNTNCFLTWHQFLTSLMLLRLNKHKSL